MKALIPFFIALAAIALFSSAKAVDFIRQIQLISGQTVVYDIPISNATGTVRSKPIEGTGSIFQLYAYEDAAYSPYTVADVTVGNAVHANVSLGSNLVDVKALGLHLDINLGEDPSASSLPKLLAEKAVGSFIPEATVTLASADPYFPPRTRADQPYTVKIAISRLPVARPDSQIPDSAPTKVRLERSYKLYHPTLRVPVENGSGQGSYGEAFEFTLNGTYSIPTVYQNLPGTSPTRVIGEESHSALIRLGSGSALAASIGAFRAAQGFRIGPLRFFRRTKQRSRHVDSHFPGHPGSPVGAASRRQRLIAEVLCTAVGPACHGTQTSTLHAQQPSKRSTPNRAAPARRRRTSSGM